MLSESCQSEQDPPYSHRLGFRSTRIETSYAPPYRFAVEETTKNSFKATEIASSLPDVSNDCSRGCLDDIGDKMIRSNHVVAKVKAFPTTNFSPFFILITQQQQQ